MSQFPTENRAQGTIVHLPARVDVTNAREFVDAIQVLVHQEEKRIIIDCSQTETIDSTALGALIQLHKAIRAYAGVLQLAAVGDGVRRVLAITRIDRIFELFPTAEEALATASSEWTGPVSR